MARFDAGGGFTRLQRDFKYYYIARRIPKSVFHPDISTTFQRRFLSAGLRPILELRPKNKQSADESENGIANLPLNA